MHKATQFNIKRVDNRQSRKAYKKWQGKKDLCGAKPGKRQLKLRGTGAKCTCPRTETKTPVSRFCSEWGARNFESNYWTGSRDSEDEAVSLIAITASERAEPLGTVVKSVEGYIRAFSKGRKRKVAGFDRC